MKRLLNHIRSYWPNIAGLVVGFACINLVLIWLNHEKNYDRFYHNSPSLFRVKWKERASESNPEGLATTPSKLGPQIAEVIPEIIQYSRFYRLESFLGEVQVESDNKPFYEKDYCFADPSFFSLFELPFIYGNAEYALSFPNSVVLTRETAEKYFGSVDPTGEILKIKNFGEYIVSGVIEDIPSNSHIKFAFLSPLEPLLQKYEWMNRWNIPHFYTYLELIKGTDREVLDEKINKLLSTLKQSDLRNLDVSFQVEPITEIHFKSEAGRELPDNGKYIAESLRIFTLLALLVLVISCLNFIIIFVAKAFEKRNEIALRKTFGATKAGISSYYYLNALILTVLSFILSIIMVMSLFPRFKDFIGVDINIGAAGTPTLIPAICLMIILSSMISGLLPALYISSFKPAIMLRGSLFFRGRRVNYIKGFIVLQFAISIFFLVGSLVYNKQYKYLTRMHLGYNYENIYCLRANPELKKGFDSFSKSLLNSPLISDVTSCSSLPDGSISSTLVNGWEGSINNEQLMMNYLYVDQSFVQTLNIEIREGRDFPIGSGNTEGFIMNETAVKYMGLQDPIPKRFNLNGQSGHIIGVVKDFNFESLNSKINPLVIKVDPGFCKYVLIRVSGSDIESTIKFIEGKYNTFSPGYLFEVWSLEGVVRGLYGNEKKSASLIAVFSFLGIMIASIGLFGLIEYTVRIRNKEIGIRKSLGADSKRILCLFVKEHGKLIMISGLLAAPFSYLYYSTWLNNYAYRIPYKLWYLPGAVFIVLIISSLVVILRTVKTSVMKSSDLLVSVNS